jgi:hypothetical protein
MSESDVQCICKERDGGCCRERVAAIGFRATAFKLPVATPRRFRCSAAPQSNRKALVAHRRGRTHPQRRECCHIGLWLAAEICHTPSRTRAQPDAYVGAPISEMTHAQRLWTLHLLSGRGSHGLRGDVQNACATSASVPKPCEARRKDTASAASGPEHRGKTRTHQNKLPEQSYHIRSSPCRLGERPSLLYVRDMEA